MRIPFGRGRTVPASILIGVALNLAVFALLGATILAAAWRENAVSRQQARERVVTELADLRDSYAAITTDYAWWDEARDRIEGDHDAAWADENIAQWLTQTVRLDAAYAFDGQGRNIYSSRPGGDAPGDLGPLLQAARAAQHDQPRPVTGFATVDGRRMLVTAALLRPMEAVAGETYAAVLVFAWDMQTVLERLRANARMGELAQAPGSDTLEIADIHGQPVVLGWPPERPGSRFAAIVLPAAGGGLAVLSAIGWWFWLRARQHWRALVAAEESRTRLLAAVSHDLRQPLQSFALFSTAMAAEVTSERGRTALAFLRQGVERMDELLEAILKLARLDMQRPGALDIRAVALDEVISGVVEELRPQAQAKGLNLRHVSTGLTVTSEPVLLTALLRNLVSNAIRYTPQGTVLVGVRRRRTGPEIWVCDTGLGIAEDSQKLIFEEFFQVDNPSRDPRLGIGLGLSIVQRLARILDCRIRLRSQPGKGSLFAVGF